MPPTHEYTTDRLIGIGSPHSFDRAGWDFVESAMTYVPPRIHCHTMHGPLDLLHLPPSRSWWIVDACVVPQGSREDELLVIPWEDRTRLMAAVDSTSSHGWSLLQALELAESLNRLPALTQLVLIPVPAHTAEGDRLSDSRQIARWVRELLECIEQATRQR